MADFEERANENREMVKVDDKRPEQLLQVWRDYYDELYECNLTTGQFESMSENTTGKWPNSGFAEIELILLAEKRVHPDDKAAFQEFFDFKKIAERIREGIYVTKLNFRIIRDDGSEVWIKVKNIVPTKQKGEDTRFFACFRKVDDEAGDDLRYKQELVDALENERRLCDEKTELINRVAQEIRSPLNGIIGMAALAKTDTSDPQAARERFKVIEAEAIKMGKVLRALIADNTSDEMLDFEFEDHPINKISYGRRHTGVEESSLDTLELETKLPNGYAHMNGIDDATETIEEGEFDFTGMSVLVVEDNKLNSNVICELLRKCGAEADVAEDGKASVISFVARPAGTYNVILMDLNLPILNGMSAAKCIRISGKDDAESVPIIAICSNATSADIIKTYEKGFKAFFSKPVDYRELFTFIRDNCMKRDEE